MKFLNFSQFFFAFIYGILSIKSYCSDNFLSCIYGIVVSICAFFDIIHISKSWRNLSEKNGTSLIFSHTFYAFVLEIAYIQQNYLASSSSCFQEPVFCNSKFFLLSISPENHRNFSESGEFSVFSPILILPWSSNQSYHSVILWQFFSLVSGFRFIYFLYFDTFGIFKNCEISSKNVKFFDLFSHLI